MMPQPKNVLVIKTHIALPQHKMMELHKCISQMYANGNVILLPSYCEAVIIPECVDVMCSNEENEDFEYSLYWNYKQEQLKNGEEKEEKRV